MSNKYEEALDIIKRDYACENVSKKEFPTGEEVENAIKDLQELVDKETPRNVSDLGKVDGIMQGSCPNCGKPNPYSNFTVRCTCCGQRINFVRSEEDE